MISDYYCDDGWSGTNFERPQFQRMMEDIEAGEINIVLGKDLSRFGGEYAQMGLYIEHSFEQKTVRFIAVSENIDTANGTGSLVFPFTNVVNSYYARQCSTKAKAAHGARAKTGMYLGATPHLGISRILREKRILNPQAYFNQNNPDYFQSEYWRKPFDWHATSVRSIINNPMYLGKRCLTA